MPRPYTYNSTRTTREPLGPQVDITAIVADRVIRLQNNNAVDGDYTLEVCDVVRGDSKTFDLIPQQAAAVFALVITDALGDYLNKRLYNIIGNIFDETDQAYRPIP